MKYKLSPPLGHFPSLVADECTALTMGTLDKSNPSKASRVSVTQYVVFYFRNKRKKTISFVVKASTDIP